MVGNKPPYLVLLEDGRSLGVLALADEVRPESANAVGQLRAEGVRVGMITGDARPVALAVADAARSADDEVAADVLPAARMPPSAASRRTDRSSRWSATA